MGIYDTPGKHIWFEYCPVFQWLSPHIAIARKSIEEAFGTIDLFLYSIIQKFKLCQSLRQGWPPRKHCFHTLPITLWSLQLKKWKYLVPENSKLKLLKVKIARVSIWVTLSPPRTQHISFKPACSSLLFSCLGTPFDIVISPTIAIKVQIPTQNSKLQQNICAYFAKVKHNKLN